MTKHRIAIGVLLVCVPLSTTCALAATAREILAQSKKLDDTTRHWDDSTQTMTIRIIGTDGSERVRELLVRTKRYANDEDKRLSVFVSPPETKGTGLLQWVHKGRDDDQWLYLPALKRTRQISAGIRDESFVGTDFSYRDLEIVGKFLLWTEAKAQTKLLDAAEVGGLACHSVELRPQQEGSPYGRIVVALDREQLVNRKFDFFDRRDALVKTLVFDEVRDVGRVPTAHRWQMTNVKEGSKTVVELKSVAYDSNLADDLFTLRQLERGAF